MLLLGVNCILLSFNFNIHVILFYSVLVNLIFFLCLLWQLTDFGLSKVGLINSTDDLSGPAVNGTSLLEEDETDVFTSADQRERREKRSAVGTPDYLAPEILLGTGHGSYSPIFMFKVV